MKKYLFTTLLLLTGITIKAQDIEEIKDRIALKNLVDTFSNLADVKDVNSQLDLFTKDAIVESVQDGVSNSKLEGREQIGAAFEGFLNRFETVFHQNGQQTVSISDDTANGISYCTVVLISNTNGEKFKTTFGIRYYDNYVKIDGRWFISKRTSNFLWQENKVLN